MRPNGCVQASKVYPSDYYFFNPSVWLRLDVSPIFSHENTGAKIVTNNTSQTYRYRNPTMKYAVRNRGVHGDRICHYVGDVVQELQERNVFDVRIPHAHISTPCNAPLTWGFYCTTSPTLQRCVPTLLRRKHNGENGNKQYVADVWLSKPHDEAHSA